MIGEFWFVLPKLKRGGGTWKRAQADKQLRRRSWISFPTDRACRRSITLTTRIPLLTDHSHRSEHYRESKFANWTANTADFFAWLSAGNAVTSKL
jgi:hypothetical protein